ncbi:hypothetical protein, partial [Streptomyces sp. NPDC001415]
MRRSSRQGCSKPSPRTRPPPPSSNDEFPNGTDQSSAAWFAELKKALNQALASLRILMTFDSV